MKIRHILLEAANPKTGREFQHLEDLVYIEGVSGVKRALEHLKMIIQNTKPLEVKWDGSPAILVGRDSEGRFHFGDKNIKIMITSPQQLYDYYTRKNDPERQKFATEMMNIYNIYERATPQNYRGFLECGLLYSKRPQLKNGRYNFRPNTVEYSVYARSSLGQRISRSQTGAAATGYYDKLPSQGGRRYAVGDRYMPLNDTPEVVIIPPQFTDTGAQVNLDRLRTISRYAATHAGDIEAFLDPTEAGFTDIRRIIYTYVNSQVDDPGALDTLGNNFMAWINAAPEDKISAAKKVKMANRVRAYPKGYTAVFKLMRAIMALKDSIVVEQEREALGKLGITARLKTGEPGGEGFVHDPRGGENPVKLVRRGAFTRANRLREAVEGGKTAVVGWGRGMGHKGHMYLAQSVIEYADAIDATPFFYVSETVGKDDPLTPKEKLSIYRKVFPDSRGIFHTGKNPIEVVQGLYDRGYRNLVFVVGADQKAAFGFLARPTKSTGQLPVPFDTVKVISRQETGSETANLEGPRATPMREILKDPDATYDDRFAVWRDAMPDALSDREVAHFMDLAAERMGVDTHKLDEADPPPQGSLSSAIPGTPEGLQPRPTRAQIIKSRQKARKLRKWMNG